MLLLCVFRDLQMSLYSVAPDQTTIVLTIVLETTLFYYCIGILGTEKIPHLFSAGGAIASQVPKKTSKPVGLLPPPRARPCNPHKTFSEKPPHKSISLVPHCSVFIHTRDTHDHFIFQTINHNPFCEIPFNQNCSVKR